MVKERNYLIETLKSSGIKSQVYTNMKKLKAGNEVHVGAVLRNGETFARSGSKKTYIDQEGQRKSEAVGQEHITPYSDSGHIRGEGGGNP